MAMDRFSARKHAQGYQSPIERPGCRSCRHRSPQALSFDTGGVAYNCRLGDFLVAPGGTCPQHQPAGIAALPRKDAP